jgi:hypothetical protein
LDNGRRASTRAIYQPHGRGISNSTEISGETNLRDTRPSRRIDEILLIPVA